MLTAYELPAKVKLLITILIALVGPWAFALAYGGQLAEIIKLWGELLRLIAEILRRLLFCNNPC